MLKILINEDRASSYRSSVNINNIMKYIFLLCLIPYAFQAQNIGFIKHFSGDTNKYAIDVVELSNKDLVFICSENTSNPNASIRSKLYILTESGRLKDSITFSDSLRSIGVIKIIPTSYGYCLLGEMRENNKVYFWNAKLNQQFTIISQEFTPTDALSIYLINYTVTKDSGIAAVILYSFPRSIAYNAAKINKQGSLVNYNGTRAFSAFATTIFERNDSLGYWLLDDYEWIATDTAFNITHRRNLDISRFASRDLLPTGIRKNDTTYYYVSRWTNYNDRRNRDLVFLVINTLGNISFVKTVQAGLDTNYIQAVNKSADTTKDGRFIYWGGTVNHDYINPAFSLKQSPFVLTKLNAQYATVWQKRYASNTYNLMQGVLATSDGGCVMYGRRYDYNNVPRLDAIIIKVDGNGIVTSETTIPITQTSIIAFPNPSTGQLNFKKETPSVFERFDVSIFDISGKLVYQKRESDLLETIDLTHFAEGNYMYQIQQQGVIKAVGKWVKIK